MQHVSVVIPAYNAAPAIDATLASVLEQKLRPTEVIVVDDGSTDGTGEIAGKADAAVRVIRQENSGQGSARQAGLIAAEGEYVMFLDADDQLLPNSLEALLSRLDATAGAVLAYCRCFLWNPSEGSDENVMDDVDDAEGNVWEKLIRQNFIRTPGCALARRRDWLIAGGWATERVYQGNEDWDLWLRMAEIGQFARVEERLLKYRVYTGSYSGKRTRMHRSMFAVYEKHLRRFAGDAPKLKIVKECNHNARKMIAWELRSASEEAFARGDCSLGLDLLKGSFLTAPDRVRWALGIAALLKRRLSCRQAYPESGRGET